MGTIRRSSVIVALASALGAPDAGAQDVLFAGTSGNLPNGGLFGTLDPATAEFTEIGDPTANGSLPGIARDSRGSFYGSNNAGGGGSPGVLIRIDPVTGTLLDTIGTITDGGDAGELRMSDIAFQPGTDVLFGLCATAGKDGFLYTIDVTTAAATLVGDTRLERGGLGFEPGGALWLATVGDAAGAVLASIDPSDATVIGTPLALTDGLEALAVRPGDGVLFGKERDGTTLFTVDTDDGNLTVVGNDNGRHVAAMVFAAGPVSVGAILPRVVGVKLDASQPDRSKLVAVGFFDLGPGLVNLAFGATLTVGGYEVVAPFLESNGAGTVFRLDQPGTRFLVKTSKAGSSRALFKARVQDDLTGLIDPEGELLLHFASPSVDGQGTVDLEQGKFKLGKVRGALVAPTLFLFKARAALKGGGQDSLLLKAALATDGTTPAQAPALSLAFGETFSAKVDGASFTQQGDRFVFQGDSGGLTLVVLDYLRETVTIKAQGVDLGAFAEGPQPVDVTLGLDADERTVSVRMARKGKALKY